jgi:hypothetical protein
VWLRVVERTFAASMCHAASRCGPPSGWILVEMTLSLFRDVVRMNFGRIFSCGTANEVKIVEVGQQLHLTCRVWRHKKLGYKPADLRAGQLAVER